MSDRAYVRLHNLLREQILSGKYAAGERIPTERILGDTYGVSRITTRHALSVLEQQGLIERVPGKGTFVRSNRAKKLPITDGDYSASMSHSGERVERLLESFEETALPEAVRDALGLLPGEQGLRAVRIDVVDGKTIAFDHAYFPLRFADSLDAEILVQVDFLGLWLRRIGVRLSYSRETIEAVRPSKEARQLLGVGSNFPLLLTTEVMYDGRGVAIHLAESYYNGDRFRLVETIGGEKILGHGSRTAGNMKGRARDG